MGVDSRVVRVYTHRIPVELGLTGGSGQVDPDSVVREASDVREPKKHF